MAVGGLAGSAALPHTRSVLRTRSNVAQLPLPKASRHVLRVQRTRIVSAAGSNGKAANTRVIRGPCYVTRDNIDTDQIIPAEYLTLVPSKPEEYEKLGSYALIGLPTELYQSRFIEDGEMKTRYPIVIGGQNFGCGSSREHAPVAMGAAGAKVVVAQTYARIFFRNCVSTGELYPCETDVRLCDELQTGEEVEVDMNKDVLTVLSTGKQYPLKPIGEAGPVVDAGGIFEYARRTGMMKVA
ncbi:3-isopropylmalate dehydratase small subunit [Coccomyxa sp. Obi]|nr:3-isopropylmalate dehydratase small subunit [Coccomyxa sp. Obi]